MATGFYSIGETARLTGLSVKTIRYYADEGVVAPSELSAVGYRLYAPDAIWKLTLVRLLREMEFSLPQIQAILNHKMGTPFRAQALMLDGLRWRLRQAE